MSTLALPGLHNIGPLALRSAPQHLRDVDRASHKADVAAAAAKLADAIRRRLIGPHTETKSIRSAHGPMSAKDILLPAITAATGVDADRVSDLVSDPDDIDSASAAVDDLAGALAYKLGGSTESVVGA